MSLKSIKFPLSITTGYEDPLEDFFVPLLQNCKSYNVAMGYFTSEWLRDAAEGIAEFVLNGGKCRWVISHKLQDKDADEILKGNLIQEQIEDELIGLIEKIEENPRKQLCALISCGALEFKISVPKKKSTYMFHAKIGYAEDEENSLVGFNGSYNSTSAAKSNWEYISIYRENSLDGRDRISELRERFNNLWSDKDPLYKTLAPSNNLIERIGSKAGGWKSKFDHLKSYNIQLRDYQEQAVASWGENKGRGLFAMATGSGKTITALFTIRKLQSKLEKKQTPLVCLVVLPLKHLLDQWHNEALMFGFTPLKCYENTLSWRSEFAERLSVLTTTGKGMFMPMVTNATFLTEAFQAEINKVKIPFLFVADEAHNLGSSKALSMLPDNAEYRLGLSATPERHNDEIGTATLMEYFGGAVFEFTLKEAIERKFLTPYKYFPHLCIMTVEEYDEYLEITEEIKEERKQENKDDSEYNRLIGKRADLISGVESKLTVLKSLLVDAKNKGSVRNSLIYCGSRKGEDERRHIERTLMLIGDLDIKIRKFTAAESLESRKEILNLFETGELDAIAAIKCLDEGVDVPATKTAYILASTTNPREHVQRRGRVLRKSPGKEFAVIHDFLVAPPSSSIHDDTMLIKELQRAREFSEIAINYEEVESKLVELAKRYGVEKW